MNFESILEKYNDAVKIYNNNPTLEQYDILIEYRIEYKNIFGDNECLKLPEFKHDINPLKWLPIYWMAGFN